MSSLSKLAIDWEILFKDDFVFEESKNLSSLTTLKLMAHAPLIIIRSRECLSHILKSLTDNKITYNIIGKGSNIICDNSDMPYVLLDFMVDRAILEKFANRYILPGSVPISLLTSAAMKLSLDGWEVFTGIPGTLAGSVAMNAGTNLGEIGSLIKTVWVVKPNGDDYKYTVDADSFCYRGNSFLKDGEVIWQVEITSSGKKSDQENNIREYLKKRKESQPLDKATCGCIFKNHISVNTCRAGLFIDIMGLSGFELEGLKISHKHANFMEHSGGAEYKTFIDMMKLLEDELLLNYGITFKREFQVLGSAADA